MSLLQMKMGILILKQWQSNLSIVLQKNLALCSKYFMTLLSHIINNHLIRFTIEPYVICMTTYPTCVPYFDICGVVMKSIQLLMSMLCFHYLSICSDVLHRIPHSTNKFMNEENPSIEDKGEGDFMSGHTRIQSVYRIRRYFLHQILML